MAPWLWAVTASGNLRRGQGGGKCTRAACACCDEMLELLLGQPQSRVRQCCKNPFAPLALPSWTPLQHQQTPLSDRECWAQQPQGPLVLQHPGHLVGLCGICQVFPSFFHLHTTVEHAPERLLFTASASRLATTHPSFIFGFTSPGLR